jgi:hypothetical protein
VERAACPCTGSCPVQLGSPPPWFAVVGQICLAGRLRESRGTACRPGWVWRHGSTASGNARKLPGQERLPRQDVGRWQQVSACFYNPLCKLGGGGGA